MHAQCQLADFTSLLPDRDVIDGLVTSNLLRTPSPFVDIPPFSPDAYRVYTQEYQDENFRKWVSVGLKKARHDPYPDMEVVREETPTPADVLLGDMMFRREKSKCQYRPIYWLQQTHWVNSLITEHSWCSWSTLVLLMTWKHRAISIHNIDYIPVIPKSSPKWFFLLI